MDKQNIVPDTIANLDQVKQKNSANIYKVIEQYKPISRVEIAKVSSLAPASVTKITRQLMESGLITEVELQVSTGGRRAISLAPNSDNINIIAIKLGQNLLSIAHYNLSGEKGLNKQITIPKKESCQMLTDFLIGEIAKFITQPTLINEKISAISLTISGLVNPKQGVVISTPTYPFDHFPLANEIEKAFNIPTFIGNHTRCRALAENYFGATKHCQDSILISVHHGVGSGVIIDNKVLLGKNCNIGEIGHIQANPLGKACYCGNIGCLETEVSDTAILNKVKEAISAGKKSVIDSDNLDINAIYLAAANGDQLCQSITEQAANYLGKSIAILVNLLNPEKIILAGKIITAGDIFFDTVKACIKSQTLPDFNNKLEVIGSELSSDITIAAFALIKQAIYEGNLLQRIKV